MLRLPTENTSDREEKTMVDWIEKSLGEIAEVTKLAGFEFTKYIKYNDDGEIIALRALNLRNGELDLSDIKRISREVSEGLTRSKIYKDDILLTYDRLRATYHSDENYKAVKNTSTGYECASKNC